jgi:hypothetical protein
MGKMKAKAKNGRAKAKKGKAKAEEKGLQLKIPNWPILSMSLAIAVLIWPFSSPSIRPIVTSRLIFASSHSTSSSAPDVPVL